MTISKGVWTDQKRFVVVYGRAYSHSILVETIQDSLTERNLGPASNATMLECINILADELREIKSSAAKNG